MAATATELSCTCGTVRFEARGAPILAVECHCNSCRDAATRLGTLPGAPEVRTGNGGVPYVLYRKDRVEVTRGGEQLKQFRLRPDTPTRRIVATCCNTPVFLEFKGGHWLSVFSGIWPEQSRPKVEMRTMTSDLPDTSQLDDTIPNGKRQSTAFFAKLLGAWIAMGFRTPKVEVNGELKA